jgi:hypothetical protein
MPSSRIRLTLSSECSGVGTISLSIPKSNRNARPTGKDEVEIIIKGDF